jgi:hypothetical protein
MTLVEPFKSKIILDNNIITIPGRKNWLLSIFLGFWLLSWMIGEVFVGYQLFNLSGGATSFSEKAPSLTLTFFMLVWFVCWTIGGLAVWYIFLWIGFGRERISRVDQYLRHEMDFLIYTRKRDYELNHIRNIRAEALVYNPASFAQRPSHLFLFFGIGGGVLAFDYGDGIVHMGAKSKLDEQKILFELIKKLFPDKV